MRMSSICFDQSTPAMPGTFCWGATRAQRETAKEASLDGELLRDVECPPMTFAPAGACNRTGRDGREMTLDCDGQTFAEVAVRRMQKTA